MIPGHRRSYRSPYPHSDGPGQGYKSPAGGGNAKRAPAWLFGLLSCSVLATAPACHAGQTIHIKVLVDEEEPRNRRVWQQTLAHRIDKASEILSQYCDLRFSVTSFGRWRSNNEITEFARSVKEFEKTTKVEPADLVIGFSSQYKFGRGRTSLGGTRGPLNSHILIREGSPTIQESERLEVVVHELCHYLGAAHSNQYDSVMRPVLGDGRSRARAFQIKLDPRNATIVGLVSDEVIDFRVRNFNQLTIPTKLRLREQYILLARQNPRDPVAAKYARLMDKSIRLAITQAQLRQQAIKAMANPARHPSSPPSESARPR